VWNRSIVVDRWVVALLLLLLCWGIGSFGIWDPWELEAAEIARTGRWAPANPSGGAPLRPWLTRLGFEWIGLRPWAGRFVGIIGAALAGGAVFALLRDQARGRAAWLGVGILATTPLFLLNARLMAGASWEIAAQAWVGVAAWQVSTARVDRWPWGAWALLVVALITSTLASGALLGPLPPLCAVAVCGILTGDVAGGDEPRAPLVLWLVTVVAVAGTGYAFMGEPVEFSFWLGGGPVHTETPTFDEAIEIAFHGLAPWSAFVPFAMISLIAPSRARSLGVQRVAWMLVGWSAFGYVAWTLFASRYDTPPWLATVPILALVALFVDEVAADPRPRWATAAGVVLLTGLLIRDFALFPESALRGLAIEGIVVPNAVNGSSLWAAVFGAFALASGLLLVAPQAADRPHLRNLQDTLRRAWSSSTVSRGWLMIAASVGVACLAYGALCFVVELPISSLAVRLGRIAFFVPFAVALVVLASPWLRYGLSRLGRFRLLPVWMAALGSAALVVVWLQPALSRHFSAKDLYDRYVELSEGRPEPLAIYRDDATAARYYTDAHTREIKERAALVHYLLSPEPRWAIVSAEELIRVNKDVRRRTSRHVFVADARSERRLLLSSTPVEGTSNQNFLERRILDRRPEIAHPLDATFADRVELLGYDLELPHEDDVIGPGERFAITWFWRLIGKKPRGYEVFVHVDGFGRRINGDHIPMEGFYPFRHWEPGDIIVDRQTLRVPATFRPGEYTIYVGLFKGEHRLEVTSGPDDGADRVPAGRLRVE